MDACKIMNIIYVSSVCSKNKFEYLRDNGIIKTIPQAQKYHQLLVDGLSKIIDGEIFTVTAIPTNRKWSKQFKYKKEQECVDNVTYIYEEFYNYPVLRQLSLTANGFKTIKRLCKEHKNTVIVCDVLNYSISKSAIKVGKKYGVKTVGIVTDIPGMLKAKKNGFSKIIDDYFIRKKLSLIEKFDSYLLLAEAMNEVINKKKKPYVVIEGQSDVGMLDVDNKFENKIKPKVIMYAGSLHKEYGVKILADAFISGNYEGFELHIYGDGNYASELQSLASVNSAVKFFGLVSNEEVVKRQLSATLLVNPRPTNADFVKYSFPSKTMEYMASGTPLLTTRIPSMPNEYYKHVYFIEDETVSGVKKALTDVLSKSDEELYNKGKQAKEFILKEKNNLIQAKKIIEFIKKLTRE